MYGSSAPPDRWMTYLTSVRLALAVASLILQVILTPIHNPLVTAAIGLFAVSAVVTVRKRTVFRGTYGLLALFTDTIFFMILAKFGAEETLWLAPAFYLYLTVTAAAFYGPREVTIIATVCTIYFMTAHPGQQYFLRETILVGGAFAIAYSWQKRKVDTQFEQTRIEAESLRSAIEVARENEQQRIAADFHDGPLQSMISFQMRLEILKRIFERDKEQGLAELAQLQDMSKAQVREMRAFVRDMRPLDIDGASLTAATRRLIDDFQKESGIPVTFASADKAFAAAPETCTDVLQMVREGLNNVRKHAKATRAAVAMEKVGRILEVSIDDNGVGFQFSGSYTLDELELLKMGPVSLKRRARSLGADMQIESKPGRGTGIKMKVPIS